MIELMALVLMGNSVTADWDPALDAMQYVEFRARLPFVRKGMTEFEAREVLALDKARLMSDLWRRQKIGPQMGCGRALDGTPTVQVEDYLFGPHTLRLVYEFDSNARRMKLGEAVLEPR